MYINIFHMLAETSYIAKDNYKTIQHRNRSDGSRPVALPPMGVSPLSQHTPVMAALLIQQGKLRAHIGAIIDDVPQEWVSQLHKQFPLDRFCHQIRNHLFGRQKGQLNFSIVNSLFNIKISNIYLACSPRHTSARFGHPDGRHIILIKSGRLHIITNATK